MTPLSTERSEQPEVLLIASPVPMTARAWWGTQLIAESTHAIKVNEPGQHPALYFPAVDVHDDLLLDGSSRVTSPVTGVRRLWTLAGTAPRPASGSWTAYGLPPVVDGRDAAWTLCDPAPGLGWLAGSVCFDHERVRVELVDTMGSAEPRDVTSKRFPTWGDAADLIDLLQVRPQGHGRFASTCLADSSRPVVEGSQMLAQAIVAACHEAPGRRVVSAHMVFVRGADAAHPLELEVEQLNTGRTFTSCRVHVTQGGRLSACGTVLLDVMAPDAIRHAEPAPDVTSPYDNPSFDMGVLGRDLRVVDGAYVADPDAPTGPPVLDCWVRFASVPDEPAVHAALLAQFTGHLSLSAAMRPHAGVGEAQAHRTLSTGINAISIAFHAPIRADQWMLYHHRSTFAGDGMTHAECRVHDEEGVLLASFSVEAMLRGFADPSRPVDDRTAM